MQTGRSRRSPKTRASSGLYRALTVGALLVASAVAWLFLRPTAPVTVTLMNEGAQPITRVVLTHEDGVELAQNIGVGEDRVLKFRPRGETEYSLDVEFAGGTRVVGQGTYAEPGYRFQDAISEGGVTNTL